MARPKVLMLTRVFPNSQWPTLGTFCAERVKALSPLAEVRVMAPVPWFPQALGLGKWGKWAKVERRGLTPEGIEVTHPRYITVPKIATFHQGYTLAWSVQAEFAAHYGDWVPDVIDSHFAFPDGFAAMKLAARIGCGYTITCHRSGLEVYPKFMFVKPMIRKALARVDRVLAVSPYMRDRAVELGCEDDRSIFVPNGVDTDMFTPGDKSEARRQLGLPDEGTLAVCVGYLIKRKNQSVLIEALAALRKNAAQPPRLALVGAGQMEAQLRQLADQLGVADLVHFAGGRPYEEIPQWMAAADWLVLSSLNEGWPTVYFEAMGCGRPVITSKVAAAQDAIYSDEFGLVVSDNTADGFAQAFTRAMATQYDPQMIRSYAAKHSWPGWAETAAGIIEQIRSERSNSQGEPR